jgi:DNA-binding MarR family transcriptional regulator
MTRVVERLSRQGLVERVRAESDRRGQIALLTEVGFARLEEAWPSHLASVRRRVMDHLVGVDLRAFAAALASIAAPELGFPLGKGA